MSDPIKGAAKAVPDGTLTPSAPTSPPAPSGSSSIPAASAAPAPSLPADPAPADASQKPPTAAWF
ncbi:MAG: hypothetical protein JWO51_147 [Rhodospirillales bacterium]|nr:hypothetical protein [Rhodospirillales bacterium]